MDEDFDLDVYAREIHRTAVDHNFWDKNTQPSFDKLAAKLALVHSEVTETLEAIRKGKGQVLVVEEMADTIIRVLDLYGAMCKNDIIGVSLQEIFDDKIRDNKNRPVLHGHKWG